MLLLRLVTCGEEGQTDTSRRARRDELTSIGPEMGAVLDTLAATRLVAVRESLIELNDDSLITVWPRLREWRVQGREDLRMQHRLSEAARMWEQLWRDPGALLRGMPLRITRDWAGRDEHDRWLTPAERRFLQTCITAEAEEHDTRSRYRRQLRLLTVGLVVLLIVLVGVAGLALASIG